MDQENVIYPYHLRDCLSTAALVLFAATVFIGGCEDRATGDDAAPENQEEQPTQERPADEQTVQSDDETETPSCVASGSEIAGANYTVSQPGLELNAGTDGVLELQVTPADGFKINLEYPWNLNIGETSQASIEQLVWRTQDALTFTEESVVFQIPVSTEQTGVDHVCGHLRFSICNDSRCDTPREDISWVVSVE